MPDNALPFGYCCVCPHCAGMRARAVCAVCPCSSVVDTAGPTSMVDAPARRRHPRPRSRPRSASPIPTFVAIVDPSLHSSLSSIHRVDTARQLHPCAHIALPSHLHAHGDLHPCTLHASGLV